MSDHGEDAVATADAPLASGESHGWRDAFKPGVIVRVQYATYLFMGLVVCMIFKGTGGKVFENFSVVQRGCDFLQQYTQETSGVIETKERTVLSQACFENTLVYRVSFSLALFFFVHFCSVSDLTCCIDAHSRAQFQQRFFFAKTFLLSSLITISFWIPNAFFATYAWACLFLSAIFLIIQIILIVDFSYQWNDEWGRRSDANAKWQYYLAAIAFVSYAFGIGMTIANYIFFAPHEDCNFNAFAVTSVLIGMVITTMIAIWVPHGSIVPSGIVFAYCSAICFSALRTGDDPHCNLQHHTDETWGMIVLGALFSGAALGYTVVSSSGDRSTMSLQAAHELDDEHPDDSGHLSDYCFFYIIMMMGSMYLAMLVTDWQVSGSGSNHSHVVSFWVKIATVWVTMLVYLWTLLAPYFCCKDRDFGIDTTDW